ncbi:sugar phosphate isomerase/epimerase family protein [Nocardioides sp. Root140]|uniref:sugar phosphate isomerase/epimerase family protein n=1 Tax=Nocardioides sp. Root140 TaxID=1736460 RepID=UPI0009E677B3|nr:sugar phosphate isomerase/epimerase family protein [Nocardioides sp. Root140]
MVLSSISTIAMNAWALPDLLACLSRLRVDRVAIGSRQLEGHGWREAEAAIKASGLVVGSIGSGLTTPASVDSPAGREQLELAAQSIDFAARLGIPVVTLTTGPAGPLCWEEALTSFAVRLAPLAARADDLGITLTVENTHSLRSDVSFLHTLRDAVAAARHLGVGVCADLYCCWAEPRLAATLADGLDVIRIVQYGDFVHGTLEQPNRWVPGDGDLPLDRLVRDVVAAGYTGVHEIEILGPRIDAEGVEGAHARALEWLDRQLSKG